MLRITPERMTILISIILSIFVYFISQGSLSFNQLIADNMTQIVEDTKMPPDIILIFAILLAGIFIYMWINGGKPSENKKLIEKMDELLTELKKERNNGNNEEQQKQSDSDKSKS